MTIKPRLSNNWPVLTTYDQEHLARIALPLGGIGTGTVSLGGRGDLRDWEIANRPAKGFTPLIGWFHTPFFALYTRPGMSQALTRLLEGPLELEAYEGAKGSKARNHGLPRFRRCAFAAAYPFGQVMLSDPDVPVDVRIEAFNPLVPGDAEKSGLPVAVLRFVLTNKIEETIVASVCANIPNFVGADGLDGMQVNRNEFRKGNRAQGIFMRSEGGNPKAETWGTLALSTIADTGVTYRTDWTGTRRKRGNPLKWGHPLLDFWEDFSSDGEIEERESEGMVAPVASLAVKVTIPPGSTSQITFLVTWHFPNRQTWTPLKRDSGSPEPNTCSKEDRVGNYYTTQYADAWHVAEQVAAALPELEAETLEFVQAFCDSDLPDVVKEAALYNLSTLRTQTCFRTEDGRFYGFEGCEDSRGMGLGSCTHVWNYEQATAYLFGDLARGMREVEFGHTTRQDGLMCFRVHLPLSRAEEQGQAAADGQMGCLMKLYRDWQLSGDDEMLRALWPKARKALEFCWIKGGWDADRDGVMEGCQHNTMDVEYYGPNPQMGTWYLGALRAAEEMARYLGENDFAVTCRDLFERGSRWIDEHLYNGEYYEHEIHPPGDEAAVAPGLRVGMGATDLADPDLQLGAGCLVDQLVGQYMAHVCGLGYLLDPEKVRRTLQSIMRYNYKEGFHDHFNPMRSFVLGDESGILMATYPRGQRPRRPFPYYSEVMTGFEYTAAVHMLYEGLVDDGLKCIRAIRDRYDGRKRSPFDEAECGHHYVRALASWAAVLAWTGFHYSGVDKSMTFAAREGLYFWSNGYAWGTCEQRPIGDHVQVTLRVLHGSVTLRRLAIHGVGAITFDAPDTIARGEYVCGQIPRAADSC